MHPACGCREKRQAAIAARMVGATITELVFVDDQHSTGQAMSLTRGTTTFYVFSGHSKHPEADEDGIAVISKDIFDDYKKVAASTTLAEAPSAAAAAPPAPAAPPAAPPAPSA